MRNPFFLAYGLALLLMGGYVQYRGGVAPQVTQINNVPKSVRENPGVYRSHYAWLPRWFGGK